MPDASMHRKLNLGCGFDKREGFVNADSFAACVPDVLFDIETTPWPLPDNGFDYVLVKHVLEHVGAELARLQGHAAALQTARNTYLQALKAALPVLGVSDTIKIS